MTTEIKHEELRECGTCGSPYKPQLHDEAVDYNSIRQVYYWCSSCGAMSCASRYNPLIQSGKQIAIEKSRVNWNRRASDARIAELEAALLALQTAVNALPVEEWVEQERDGSPVLLGYVMQAQGEWDDVRKAEKQASAALGEQP